MNACYDCYDECGEYFRCEPCRVKAKLAARVRQKSKGLRACPKCGCQGHYQKTCSANVEAT